MVKSEFEETSSIACDCKCCGDCSCCWSGVSVSARAVSLSIVVSVEDRREGINAVPAVGVVVWSHARSRSDEILKGRHANVEVPDAVTDDEIVTNDCLAVGEACRIGKF